MGTYVKRVFDPGGFIFKESDNIKAPPPAPSAAAVAPPPASSDVEKRDRGNETGGFRSNLFSGGLGLKSLNQSNISKRNLGTE